MFGSLNAREDLRSHMADGSGVGSFHITPISVSVTTHQHTDDTDAIAPTRRKKHLVCLESSLRVYVNVCLCTTLYIL